MSTVAKQPWYAERVKRHPKGRVCKSCDVVLSTYNESDYCSVHEPEPDWRYNGLQFAVCAGCGEVIQVRRNTTCKRHYCSQCKGVR